DIGDLEAGILERLDQRIGKPLAQLVKRHDTARRAVTGDRVVAAAIAERHPVEHKAARPDRPEGAQHQPQHLPCPEDIAPRPRENGEGAPARPGPPKSSARPGVPPPRGGGGGPPPPGPGGGGRAGCCTPPRGAPAVIFFRAAASAPHGCDGSDEKSPACIAL